MAYGEKTNYMRVVSDELLYVRTFQYNSVFSEVNDEQPLNYISFITIYSYKDLKNESITK